MSSRQLRKLRELHGSVPAEEPDAEHSEQDGEQHEGVQKVSAFHALVDSESAESEEEPQAPKDPPPTLQAPTADKPRQPRKRRGKRPKAEEAGAEPALNADPLEASMSPESPEANGTMGPLEEEVPEVPALEAQAPLSMCRADFSMETERQRVFGSRERGHGLHGHRKAGAKPRGQVEGRTLHHRRLFLVSLTPDEPWAKPETSARMVTKLDQDGAVIFGFEETAASSRDLTTLRQVVSQEDPQLLQQYLQRNPFSLDGLLVLIQYHRQQGSYDQARELVRRAAYTLECSMSPDFSPFQTTGIGPGAQRPRVRLEIDNIEKSEAWFGWSWLLALWHHIHCLRGQGMQRTALEVCKLLLACTLPHDPAHCLLFFDFLCLRSRSFQALQSFVEGFAGYGLGGSAPSLSRFTRPDFSLPSMAYSLALCTQLARGQGSCPDLAVLSHLPLDSILSGTEDADWEEDMRAHARLMRALLFFPGCLRPLLDECSIGLQSKPGGSTSSTETWAELLASAPFSNAMEFTHEQHATTHGRLCMAYAKLCSSFWKDAITWLHACCSRWVRLHSSSVFVKDIEESRRSWASSKLALCEALADYKDLHPSETEENPAPPPILERALAARLHPPNHHGHPFAFTGAGGMDGMHMQVQPNMSLHSPPGLLFFQSLLPWSELDHTGVQVSPLFWRDVLQGALAVAKGTGLVALGGLADVWRAVRALFSR